MFKSVAKTALVLDEYGDKGSCVTNWLWFTSKAQELS